VIVGEPTHLSIRSIPDLTPRRTVAWAVSVGAHAVALVLAVWFLHRAALPPPPPERMVFIEPAAPPPPPVGVANNPPVAAVLPAPIVERPKEVVRPQRLVVPKPKPKRDEAPSPVPAAQLSSEPQGAAGGVAAGVVGGEAGGKVGGRVGGTGDRAIPADQVEHPPIVVSRIIPTYPAFARARGLEGLVVLTAIVDRAGHVEEAITVTQSIPMLDAAAVDALRRWRFEPGRDRDGAPVRVLIEVPIRFQLR
jgi:protein TonB